MATLSSARSTPDIPFLATVLIGVANPNRDGTGTIGFLCQGGGGGISPGSMVNRIEVHAIGPTTSGMIRIFARANPSAAYYLLYELPVAAVTPSPTEPSFSDNYIPGPFGIQAGAQLGVSTEKAESFHVIAFGNHF